MNIRMMAAAALGAALFVWTVASVGMATLASQINQLGIMLPLVLTLAAVRFALQAAGWRIAMGSSPRPTMAQTLRAVVAGEAAGYLTWGPISREPVKVLMVSEHTPERVSLAAAIVERVAYMAAAAGLVVLSLVLVAVRANRAGDPFILGWPWLLSGIAGAIVVGGLWFGVKRRMPEFARNGKWRAKVAGYASMSPGAIMALVMCAVLQELINVMETYVVLAWLGATPTLETAIALEGLNRLANAPAQLIPGKLGVLELAGSAFAGILQLGSANGLTLVLARRVRSLTWTGVGILLLTTSASRARTVRREPVIIG
jgi:lysylphosphatidylglycerol synthase-like protein